MKIVIATGNTHKKIELDKILASHTLIMPKDLGIEFHHEETENTFLGNSMGKARTLYNMCNMPVLADDSGLVVPAIGGEPGVYSARYGSDVFGRELSSVERNNYLLKNMTERTDRRAYFVCCMTLILDDQRFYTVQETVSGEIVHEGQGSNGFGYDPVFFVPSYHKTMAELPEAVKNQISHRALAGKALARILSEH